MTTVRLTSSVLSRVGNVSSELEGEGIWVVDCREKSTILVHSFGTNSLMDWDDDVPGSSRPRGMF